MAANFTAVGEEEAGGSNRLGTRLLLPCLCVGEEEEGCAAVAACRGEKGIALLQVVVTVGQEELLGCSWAEP